MKRKPDSPDIFSSDSEEAMELMLNIRGFLESSKLKQEIGLFITEFILQC